MSKVACRADEADDSVTAERERGLMLATWPPISSSTFRWPCSTIDELPVCNNSADQAGCDDDGSKAEAATSKELEKHLLVRQHALLLGARGW
jgi:hypothetical protein